MAKVLLVEDDPEIAGSVLDWLKHENHTVEHAPDGQLAGELLLTYTYDVVVLDWQLPHVQGIDVLRRFRSHGGKTPVIMMTGKNLIDEKMEGLDSGADDYVTKPVDVRELSARIRALLRRSPDVAQTILAVGKLSLDPTKSIAALNNKELNLAKREFQLLDFLMRHPQQYFSAEALLERVWSSEVEATVLSVRVCVKRLRDKLDEAEPGAANSIENTKGLGYRLLPL